MASYQKIQNEKEWVVQWTGTVSSEWQPSMGKMEGLTNSVINTKGLIAENGDAEASKELPKKKQKEKNNLMLMI